jgi:hypothetical protein
MRDDGVLYICDLDNTAENGNMPREYLRIINKYWFENRYIGYGRSYAAQGVNERIDRLVRVKQSQLIHVGQYAVLGNGEQYRITLVSHGQDVNERTKMVNSKYYRQPTVVGLKYTELTLVKLENNYDITID